MSLTDYLLKYPSINSPINKFIPTLSYILLITEVSSVVSFVWLFLQGTGGLADTLADVHENRLR